MSRCLSYFITWFCVWTRSKIDAAYCAKQWNKSKWLMKLSKLRPKQGKISLSISSSSETRSSPHTIFLKLGVPKASLKRVWRFFRVCLLFKRDSFPDISLVWHNENALFWAGNEQRLSNKVACFVHVAGRFSSFWLYLSSYNLLIGWQVLGFQILSRITQMAPIQIKVVYDYYSAKRTTLFFITEEELLKGRSHEDFADFWSNLC